MSDIASCFSFALRSCIKMILGEGVWIVLLLFIGKNTFKFPDNHSGVLFDRNIATTRVQFGQYMVDLPRFQDLHERILDERSIDNGEIRTAVLCADDTDCFQVPQAAFLSKENGIFHGGELQLRECRGFQLIFPTDTRSFSTYAIENQFSLQPRNVKLPCPFSHDFLSLACGFFEINEIHYWDLVSCLLVILPWYCIFILLIWFKVRYTFRSRRLRFTRYRGHIWSRRKAY